MARRSKTVSSFVVQGVMRSAEETGMSPMEFLRRTGLTLDEVQDPRGRIGRVKYERVLGVLPQLPMRPRPSSGERLGRLGAEFPLLASALLNAPTLRAAIASFLAFRPILGESDWVTVRENGEAVRIEYVEEGPPEAAGCQAARNFSLLANLIRCYDQGAETRFTGQLVGPARQARSGLEGVLRARLSFEQRTNLLQFPRTNLDVPFARYNPALTPFLVRRLSAEVRDLQREGCFSLAVEREVREALARGRGDLPDENVLERLCHHFGVSRWTLRRRLAEEGLSFRGLFLKVKLEEARRLLEETSLSIGEVSEKLGFSSQTSFTRFFRAEVGAAPAHYRSRRLEE